jgi:F0F1-type ATP synthase alpha subunit
MARRKQTEPGKRRTKKVVLEVPVEKPEPRNANIAPGIRWTAGEIELHLSQLERIMQVTLSRTSICRAMREQYGLGQRRTNILMQRVYQRWADEDAAARPYTKATQIRRIKANIERARTGERQLDAEGRPTGKWVLKPDLRTVERFESLLADIEGNRAAIEVAVEHRLGNAAQAVIAAMTAEELNEVLQEARTERALANKARQLLGDGRPVLEAVGEPT